jgi:hypothetical protein
MLYMWGTSSVGFRHKSSHVWSLHHGEKNVDDNQSRRMLCMHYCEVALGGLVVVVVVVVAAAAAHRVVLVEELELVRVVMLVAAEGTLLVHHQYHQAPRCHCHRNCRC